MQHDGGVSAMVVIMLQYISVTKQHVHLQLIQCYMSIISQ